MESVKNWMRKLSSYDNRKGQRLASPRLVAYYWDGSVPMAHEIQNISSTGFYLLTNERWLLGTVVTMTLQRTDIEDAKTHPEGYITVPSKVIRLGADGVAFEFVPLSDKAWSDTNGRTRGSTGRMAMGKFIESLKSDQGYAMIGSSHQEFEKGSKLNHDARPAMHVGRVMKGLGGESGQALITVALCTTCLFGFVALAADVGIMLREKRLLQIAADSAAIAGAAEYNYGDASTAAQAAATQNGFTNAAGGATITVNSPPSFGPHATVAGYVEVIASQSEPTLFMGFFGRSAMTVTARAVATNAAGSTCMYLLGTSGINIDMSGTGSLDVPNCGIIADSNNNNGAITNSGTGSITAKSIGVVGSPGFSGARINPTPTPGIVASSDPLAFLAQPTVPSSGCTSFSNSGTSPITLTPGCYSSLSITGTGAVTVSAGLYILNGPVTLTGTGSITGSNVTFYITSAAGAVTITGTQPVTLSAPTSGADNGILFFEQRGDTNPFTVTGTGNMNLTGIFYLPSASLVLTGTGNATLDAAFVVNQLLATGTGTVSLTDYALTNSETPLTSVRLVE